jgi:hypothetical protein
VVSKACRYLRKKDSRPSQLERLPKRVSGGLSYYVAEHTDADLVFALEPTHPPRLYVDTDLDGDLSDEKRFVGVLGQSRNRRAAYRFGVISVRIVKPGEKRTAKLFVEQYSDRYLAVYPAGCCTGKMRLGRKRYEVAVVDGSFDGRYDGVLSMADGRSLKGGSDLLAVDLDHDGRFDYKVFERMEVQPLTRSIALNDAYYDIEMEEDGSGIRVAKAAPELGTLEIKDRDVELIFMSDSGFHHVHGTRTKWKLPVGTYRVAYAALFRRDGKGVKWRLPGTGKMGKLTTFEIEEGEVSTFDSGPPLAVKTDIRKGRSGTISIGLSVVGEAGEMYMAGVERNGRRVPAPKFRILDSRGKVLAHGSTDYG